MDWDQDKGIFYFIDTADSVVRSYPVDENGVPKRSTDGVLVGVREVSPHMHDSMPHSQDMPLCAATFALFGLPVLSYPYVQSDGQCEVMAMTFGHCSLRVCAECTFSLP